MMKILDLLVQEQVGWGAWPIMMIIIIWSQSAVSLSLTNFWHQELTMMRIKRGKGRKHWLTWRITQILLNTNFGPNFSQIGHKAGDGHRAALKV